MPAIPLLIMVYIATASDSAIRPSEGVNPTQVIAATARAVPMKIARYAQRVVRQYDQNGDGRLQPAEYQAMAGQPGRADADRDGIITPDEFARYVADYADSHKLRLSPLAGQPAIVTSLFTPAEASEATGNARPVKPEALDGPAEGPSAGVSRAADQKAPDKGPKARRQTKFYVSPKRLPAGLPEWFLQRDQDGDGQLTLAEFAPKPTPAQLVDFARMDLNRDGIVTARECQRAIGKQPKR